MRPLIVVENTKRWPFQLESAEVVPARAYVTEPRFAEMRGTTVYNFCRRLGYQSLGYYVSLLAAARGHRPMPSVATTQVVGTSESAGHLPLLRAVSEELEDEIRSTLAPLKGDEFVLSVYFGRNMAKRYDRLARALFNQFPAPILIGRFERAPDGWRMDSLKLGAASEVPEGHRDFVIESAQAYFARRHAAPRRPVYRYDLAILWAPDDPDPPSDERAIRRFIRAAARHGIHAETIAPEDYGRIAEYDALFIRQTTFVNHHTYRFATRAAAEGLVVIDDPEAIVRATNKVYQAEVFARHDVPAPRTLVVHEGNSEELVERVGLPCVLKKPDGAFSLGVVKVDTAEEAKTKLEELFRESDLVVAQEFVRSDFDWRVGVLDRKALFLCRYHMARGHWQIVSRKGKTDRYGKVEAVAASEAPRGLIQTAVRAASLFGDGLFGVDLKVLDGRLMVMEVNDNPNLDADYEDAIVKDEVYDALAAWFRTRLDRRGEGAAP
ncbi:MAG TPA: RimK family protein [Longimicrobiales bacterium]|nr:RimK family protein [Longimicrobiales bacterium]